MFVKNRSMCLFERFEEFLVPGIQQAYIHVLH